MTPFGHTQKNNNFFINKFLEGRYLFLDDIV